MQTGELSVLTSYEKYLRKSQQKSNTNMPKKKLRPITCLCISLPFNSIKQVDLEMVLRFVEGKLNLGIQGQPSKTTERQNIKKKTKKECEH